MFATTNSNTPIIFYYESKIAILFFKSFHLLFSVSRDHHVVPHVPAY